MSRESRAVKVAIACAVIGASTKLTAGAITGSMSMMSSAVDSLGDLLVSIANLVVVRVAARAPDDDHNYGHAKIEGLGAMFEGGFIFAAGGFIIYEAIHKQLIGELSHDSVLGIVTMLPLLALTFGTVLFLRREAKATRSLVLESDALHYMTDVWVNLGVLVSLILVLITGLPVIDTCISIAIALYMLWSSLHIVAKGFGVVMDRALEPPVVAAVAKLLHEYPLIQSFHDFKTRAGRVPHVDFHVVVAGDTSTQVVHDLFLELQREIRAIVGADTKVLMHADPAR
jgi:cation diffusion facilitator family transporter